MVTLVNDLVKKDLDARLELGISKYGNPITVEEPPHNNMIPLQNAYEEVLDLAIYMRKEIADRENIVELIKQANVVVDQKTIYGDGGTHSLLDGFIEVLEQALINAGVRWNVSS